MSATPSTDKNRRRRYAAYLRVSTPRQRDSGFGLAAQQREIDAYVEAQNARLAVTFLEIRRAVGRTVRELDWRRPALAAAIAYCREHKVRLVVAQMDRLTRSVALASSLLESDIPVEIAALPGAPLFVLQIYAIMAQAEQQRMSARAQARTAAMVGRDRFRRQLETCRCQSGTNKAASVARAEVVRPLVEEVRRDDPCAAPLRLARALNARGSTTPGGRTWSRNSARKLIGRLDGTYTAMYAADRPRQRPGERTRVAALERAESLRGTVEEILRDPRCRWARSFVARGLNRRGLRTVSGCAWSADTAAVLLQRLAGTHRPAPWRRRPR